MAAWRLLGGDRLGACALVAFAACATPPSAGNLPRAVAMDAARAPAGDLAAVGAATAGLPPVEPCADGPTDAVDELLDKAAAMANVEAHADALLALEGSAFTQDLRVTMARADLWRDLGRRHEALAAMRGVRERLGAAAIDPCTLFDLAELERLEGERAAARRTIASIRELHGAAAWTRANAAQLARVDGQLAAAEPVRAMSARDLLGNLRGAPDPAERLAALRALLDGHYGATAAAAAVRERAVAIAVGDAAEAVRLAGVVAWRFDAELARDFVALALVDTSPLVRRAAIAHADKLAPSAKVTLLSARLIQEDDADVFLALHDGLRRATGGGAAIAPLDIATSAGRAEVIARWRAVGFGKEAQ